MANSMFQYSSFFTELYSQLWQTIHTSIYHVNATNILYFMVIITWATMWFQEANGKQEGILGEYMTLFGRMVNHAPNVLIRKMIFKY